MTRDEAITAASEGKRLGLKLLEVVSEEEVRIVTLMHAIGYVITAILVNNGLTPTQMSSLFGMITINVGASITENLKDSKEGVHVMHARLDS